MNQNKTWYAVYTKPKWEKKVAQLLAREGVAHYCPLNRVLRQWSDRKKVVLMPLFTSYVFVQVAPEEMNLVRATEGVLNFVHWLSKPAAIKEEEIEAIRSFLNDHQEVTVEKIPVQVNDAIRVTRGALMNREGHILEVNRRTVKVLLPTLGLSLVAHLDRTMIERAEALTA